LASRTCDDQRLNLAGVDEFFGRFIESPFVAIEGRGGVKQILPVVHVEHGKARRF
jgi:hypothetical protein